MSHASHAKIDTLKRRQQAVRATLTEQHLEALVVTSLPNILYLTTFTGSSAIVILTADRLELLTDFRYLTAVRELQREGVELELTIVEGSYDAMLVQRLAAISPGPVGPPQRGSRPGDLGARVGIEGAHLTVARHLWITTSLAQAASGSVDGVNSVTLVPTEGIVERARARKDRDEIATLREAARRLSIVAAACSPTSEPA